jgi:GntR family transcriptional regulator
VNLNIVINTGSATPIYKQITDQVRLAVATGKLAIGDQLPSVRALAEELVINPNTVARAYTDLAREGMIESRPGRGVFVTPLMEGLIGEAMVMDFTQEELREAFTKKLSQCQWNFKKGADSNNE